MSDEGRERLYTIHNLNEGETLDIIETDAAAMRSLERVEAKHNECMRMFLVVICFMGLVAWLNIVAWTIVVALKVFP